MLCAALETICLYTKSVHSSLIDNNLDAYPSNSILQISRFDSMAWSYFAYLPQELDELESIWAQHEQEEAAAKQRAATQDEANIRSSQSFPPGDHKKGANLFKTRCLQCHTVVESEGNKIGPNLHGLFGRKTGSVEGFSYTDANKQKGITWTEDTLVRFLVTQFPPATAHV